MLPKFHFPSVEFPRMWSVGMHVCIAEFYLRYIPNVIPSTSHIGVPHLWECRLSHVIWPQPLNSWKSNSHVWQHWGHTHPHDTALLEKAPPTHSILEQDGETTAEYSKDPNPQKDLAQSCRNTSSNSRKDSLNWGLLPTHPHTLRN